MSEIINSKFNKKIVHLRKLITSKEYRYSCGQYVAEGLRLLDKINEVKELYIREDVSVPKVKFGKAYKIDKRVFDSISSTENSQGIIAVIKLDIQGEDCLKSDKRYCLLDRIQDPGNAGTIIRSACAFGFDGIITLPGTVDPFSPKVVRASAGTLSNINVVSIEKPESIGHLNIINADTRGRDAADFVWPEGFVLAIGNEGEGVSPEIRSISKQSVSIPISERVESLNASVSAGILFYLSLKKRSD
jgi:RNA methyltransferase, TrmH family